jgi:N-methylhydantoinase B
MTDALSELRMQVMWNRLISVAEEQAQMLMRTAFSPAVRDAGDLSVALFDADGRLVAEAVTGTPGHVNSMAEGVRHFLARFPVETMEDGDHYITNDPWLTAGHLHDITVVSPVFHRGKVTGMVGVCCHQTDIGGLGQGPDARSIFEEGLQIPLLKLASRGVVNADLMAILRQNVRTPLQVEGDVLSYIGSNDSAAKRLRAMLEEFDLDSLRPLADYIVDTSLAATRRAVAALPKGTWRATMEIDGHDHPITMAASLTITEDEILVDYAGTDMAVQRGVNVVLNYCRAYTVFALRCLISPEIPNNYGALAPFRVEAPEGSVLNVQRPWPVAARHVIGQMLPDLVFRCMAQAAPEKTPAEGASCSWVVQVRGEDEGASFDAVFFNSGGSGARPGLDGLSATAFPSGVKAMPVEVIEGGAPIVIWRKELRPDSGGLGERRGGLGQVIEVGARDDDSFEVLAMFERVDRPARGRDGGGDGATGTVRLASGGALRAKGLQRIPKGDRLVLELPGGAGAGAARARAPEAVAKDVADGFVSPGSAAADYGWRG